jgi:hypothetical protein
VVLVFVIDVDRLDVLRVLLELTASELPTVRLKEFIASFKQAQKRFTRCRIHI